MFYTVSPEVEDKLGNASPLPDGAVSCSTASFRYLYLVHRKGAGGSPTQALLDRPPASDLHRALGPHGRPAGLPSARGPRWADFSGRMAGDVAEAAPAAGAASLRGPPPFSRPWPRRPQEAYNPHPNAAARRRPEEGLERAFRVRGRAGEDLVGRPAHRSLDHPDRRRFLEDYGRPDAGWPSIVRSSDPSITTLIKLNLSWDQVLPPPASSQPWQVEGVLQAMLQDGYDRSPPESRSRTRPWSPTPGKGPPNNRWLPVLDRLGLSFTGPAPRSPGRCSASRPPLLRLNQIFPGGDRDPGALSGEEHRAPADRQDATGHAVTTGGDQERLRRPLEGSQALRPQVHARGAGRSRGRCSGSSTRVCLRRWTAPSAATGQVPARCSRWSANVILAGADSVAIDGRGGPA